MSLTERSYRLRCIALEAELEKLKKEVKDNDVTPIVIEVLSNYPGAQAELLRRLEEEGRSDQYRTEPPELAAISDDELERRARAILERRDRERAGGSP